MGEQEKYETTAEHFEHFTGEAERFISLFGLQDWQVAFHHLPLEDCRANCRFDCQAKQASISLAAEWSQYDALSPEKISKTAFHEVCELLLADMYGAATDVDVSGRLREERFERTTHAVIRRMENAVFPLLKRKE